MLNKLFTKISGGSASGTPAEANAVYAPMTGSIISLEQVPDPVFSGKMLGDGLAILPSSGDVLAPFDGEVVSLFPTGHAIGLVSDGGIECLIHIGIDTVELNGTGFTAKVKQGDKVKKGQLLIKADLAVIRASGKDVITPIIITNPTVWQPVQFATGEVQARKDIVFTVVTKHGL
jgi:glucose-specific phosphotransferase system IIA component